MSNNKQPIFDRPMSDEAIDRMVERFAGTNAEALPSLHFFEGGQSQEFYKGFVAGLAAAMNAAETFPIRHILGVFTEIQVAGMIHSTKKKSAIITKLN